MDQLTRLLIMEEVRGVKARYFRLIDMKQWDELAEVFCTDVKADFTAVGGGQHEGRDVLVEMLQTSLADTTTIHHGHNPEIQVISETEASAVWAMEDEVRFPTVTLNGAGHYHETYRVEDGEWRLASTVLTRLYQDFSEPESTDSS